MKGAAMEGFQRVRTWWTESLFRGRDKPRTDEPRRWFRWSLMLGLLGMTAMLFLSRLDHPLLEPEEGRYAEIPRQMLAEGRFLTPVLHGEDYLQKPPLLYWLVMLNYQIFGVHDWAARLVPCLAGIASVMLVTLWARRTMGFWTGLVSGAILALSGRFLYIAGMLNMDGVLCACVVAALASVHLAIASQTNRWRWIIASSVACAIGVLTKGPVAIVLVAVPLIALALLDRRVKVLSLLESAAYGGIVVGVAAPWYAYMAINDSEAAGTFVWLHNLQRYLAPFDHEKPTWYYLPSLFLGMMPWTLLAIPLARYLWQRTQAAQRRRPAALGFAILAFAWCVLFFSLSGCKRPAYVLPAFPLGAIVLATCLTHAFPWRHWMRNGYRLHAAGHGWARALLVATLGLGAFLGAAAAIVELWPWQAAVATAFCLGGVWFLFGFPARAKPVWMSWAGSTVLAFLVLILAQRTLLPGYHDRFGVRRQAAICAEYEQEDLPILTYPKRWDSVSFYTQRGDVASYAPADLAQLHHDLRRHGKAIIFVRRDGSLNELRQALPDSMRLEVIGHRQDFITVALVRAR
jgi:dolichol-phosphate mannosyltransferase